MITTAILFGELGLSILAGVGAFKISLHQMGGLKLNRITSGIDVQDIPFDELDVDLEDIEG